MPSRPAAGSSTTTRNCWPRPTRSSSDVDDENQAAVDVLHERHHGQPQGRRLLATGRRGCTPLGVMTGRQPRRCRDATRSCRSSRCSTPTPGASPHAARGLRRQPGDARAGPVARRPSPTSSRREGHRGRRRAHDLDGRAARAEGPRHVVTCGRSRAAARRCPRPCPRPTGSRLGLPILQAWGMTETSPVASVGQLKSPARRAAPRTSRPTCGRRSGIAVAGRRVPRRRARAGRSGALGRRAVGRAAGPRARGSPREYYNDDRSRRVVHRRRLAEDRRRRHGRRRRATSASSTAPRTW